MSSFVLVVALVLGGPEFSRSPAREEVPGAVLRSVSSYFGDGCFEFEQTVTPVQVQQPARGEHCRHGDAWTVWLADEVVFDAGVGDAPYWCSTSARICAAVPGLAGGWMPHLAPEAVTQAIKRGLLRVADTPDGWTFRGVLPWGSVTLSVDRSCVCVDAMRYDGEGESRVIVPGRVRSLEDRDLQRLWSGAPGSYTLVDPPPDAL